MICIVVLGVAVKYYRLRSAFKRDREESASIKQRNDNNQLITGKKSKADFLQARGVKSNLHGVIDHKQNEEDDESDDGDIPDVPIGYTSEY